MLDMDWVAILSTDFIPYVKVVQLNRIFHNSGLDFNPAPFMSPVLVKESCELESAGQNKSGYYILTNISIASSAVK